MEENPNKFTWNNLKARLPSFGDYEGAKEIIIFGAAIILVLFVLSLFI